MYACRNETNNSRQLMAMAIAISCLELFVSFLQAYIFTYLSIVFVGASVHPEH